MSTAFDPLTAGTSEDSWRSSGRLIAARRAALPPGQTCVVVLAAHPDDETLGAGGLLASCAARGLRVEVIIASDGDASHPASATHTPAQLARIRRGEADAAVQRLAPTSSVTFLGLPDGSLDRHASALREALDAVVDGPALLVSPWLEDRHPDHRACAEAARAVLADHPDCSLWQYPIWAWHWAQPNGSDLPWDHLIRFDLDAAARSARDAALAAYPSQHTQLSPLPGDEPILPPAVLAHFQRPYEVFICEPVPPAGQRAYFDRLWSASDDPWGLAERFYEIRKREIVLACLPRPHFRSAFEPGCASGLLTALLAARCDHVLAWEQSERAVELASERLADVANVVVQRGRIPDEWPDEEFDLIVISEVGYYCADPCALADRVLATLAPDGVVLACHWRRAAPDHPRTAEDVHLALGRGLSHLAGHVEGDFLLDVWSRQARSVAQAEGIVA